jgi:hypothetical protein
MLMTGTGTSVEHIGEYKIFSRWLKPASSALWEVLMRPMPASLSCPDLFRGQIERAALVLCGVQAALAVNFPVNFFRSTIVPG